MKTSTQLRWRLGLSVASVVLVCVYRAIAADRAPTEQDLVQIRFDQKLNQQLTLDLPFRDESGHAVRLGKYFSKRPVILVLGYYECPMLCTLVLNGLVEGLQDMKWSIGREFDVVDVSINPAENYRLAANKKRAYLKSYGRASAAEGWHFLTGDESSVRRLADEVGFRYAYDPISKEFAHPSGLVILTPQGKISHYELGVTFPPRQLYASLAAASQKQIGSPVQQLILLCFHYNPVTGKYSASVIGIMRVLAVMTMLSVCALVLVLVWRGRSRRRAAVVAPIPEGKSL